MAATSTARKRGMRTGSIRKNRSGSWQARVRQPDGDRITLGSFDSKADAQRAIAIALGEQVRGRLLDPRAGQVPFADYSKDWLQHRPGLRRTTIDLYDSQLRHHLVPAFGKFAINEISPAHVRRWYTNLMKAEKPSPVTVAKTYRLLRTIMNTAVEDDLIGRNPCLIKGAGAERSPERPVANLEQVWQLADAIEPRYRALVLMATFCTLRYGELFGLRRKNIDLEAGTVRVVEQATHLASGELIFGPPKTGAGRRVVSIPASLLGEIEQHLATFVGPSSDAWVFRSEKGIVPRKSNWSVLWKRVTASVGIEGLRFHDLRHTGNTLAASTGASTKELMSRMGHASPRAALIYQHATREREDAIAKALDAMIVGART